MRRFAQLQLITVNDPYAILGLSHGVTKDDIKKTWRMLASRNHPDTFIDEKDRHTANLNLQKINNAKDVLLEQLEKGTSVFSQNPFVKKQDEEISGEITPKIAVRFANEILGSSMVLTFSQPIHEYGKKKRSAFYLYYLWLTKSGYQKKIMELRYPQLINAFKEFRSYITSVGVKYFGTNADWAPINIVHKITMLKALNRPDEEIQNEIVRYLTEN